MPPADGRVSGARPARRSLGAEAYPASSAIPGPISLASDRANRLVGLLIVDFQ